MHLERESKRHCVAATSHRSVAIEYCILLVSNMLLSIMILEADK